MQCAAAEELVGVMETNISALYATARLEIRRKDGEITRLRKR